MVLYCLPSFISRVMETMMKTRQITKPKESQGAKGWQVTWERYDKSLKQSEIKTGGIKNSGFGRQMSRYGMLEFINIKSVRFSIN